MKLCECGCGQPTRPSPEKRRGFEKGEPQRFVVGHTARKSMGPAVVTDNRGYRAVYVRGRSERVREHVMAAERALGKPLPRGVQVHHVNENKTDNRPGNLVICQDAAYHKLLHLRARALAESGHADWRKCWICKSWDSPGNLRIAKRGHPCVHPACVRSYERIQRQEGLQCAI